MTIQRQLLKAQTDAYIAIKLHQERIRILDRILTWVDVFALCVPVWFLSVFAASFNAPDIAEWLSVVVSPILSGILLSLTLFTFGIKARPSLKDHQRLLSEEMILVRQIQSIINLETIPDSDASRLLDWASRLDADEAQIFTKINEKDRQKLYRESLKSFGDVDVRCPECGNSPYRFIAPQNIGSECQVCGNMIDKNRKQEEKI